MRVRYLPDTREWLIDSISHSYTVSIFKCKYLLSEILQPDKELVFRAEFDHLGSALEAVIRDEMEENT